MKKRVYPFVISALCVVAVGLSPRVLAGKGSIAHGLILTISAARPAKPDLIRGGNDTTYPRDSSAPNTRSRELSTVNLSIHKDKVRQSRQSILPDWRNSITIAITLIVIVTTVATIRIIDGKLRMAAPLKKNSAWLDGKLPLIIPGAYLLANFICIHWVVLHESGFD